jgi:hypothetical protein
VLDENIYSSPSDVLGLLRPGALQKQRGTGSDSGGWKLKRIIYLQELKVMTWKQKENNREGWISTIKEAKE